MDRYLILLRGINVGGKNKVPMAALKRFLEELGYSDVTTYIASGNVLLSSDQRPADVRHAIEEALPKSFELDSELVKVLVLSRDQLRTVIETRPPGFGDQPQEYYSDAIFLIDIEPADALAVFDPREGVDKIWAGNGVIYSQRLGSLRTRSRLAKIVGTKAYESMTIRSWATTTRLLDLLEAAGDTNDET